MKAIIYSENQMGLLEEEFSARVLETFPESKKLSKKLLIENQLKNIDSIILLLEQDLSDNAKDYEQLRLIRESNLKKLEKLKNKIKDLIFISSKPIIIYELRSFISGKENKNDLSDILETYINSIYIQLDQIDQKIYFFKLNFTKIEKEEQSILMSDAIEFTKVAFKEKSLKTRFFTLEASQS